MAPKPSTSAKKKVKQPVAESDQEIVDSPPPTTPVRSRRAKETSSSPPWGPIEDSPGSLMDFIVDDEATGTPADEETRQGSDESDVEIIEHPSVSNKVDKNTTPKPKKKASAPVARPAAQARKETPKSTAKGKKIISPEFVESESDDAELLDGSILQPGDSPYPEKSRSIVNSNKRAAPSTPPISTRRTAGLAAALALQSAADPESSPTKDVQRSPTKKVRIAVRNVDSDVTSAALNAGKDVSDSLVNPFISTGKAKSNPKIPANATFESMFGPSIKVEASTTIASRNTANEKTKTPLDFWIPRPSPEVCEVSDPGLHDPFLKKYGYYEDLPNLYQGTLVPAGNGTFSGKLRGRVFFSKWKSLIDGSFKVGPAASAVSFVRDDVYVNLSRVSPSMLAGRPMVAQGSRFEVVVGEGRSWKTAICVTPLQIRDSYISDPLNNGYPYYCIRGIFHCLEWERFIAVLCMVSGRPQLTGQVWNSVMTFQTRTPASNGKQTDSDVPDDFYNTYESPKKSAGSKPDPSTEASPAAPTTGFVNALAYEERIPVYDARQINGDFEWSAAVFGDLAGHFPQYSEDEIPLNSFVYVGYVTQFYTGNTSNVNAEWKVQALIRFVILLGTPPPSFLRRR